MYDSNVSLKHEELDYDFSHMPEENIEVPYGPYKSCLVTLVPIKDLLGKILDVQLNRGPLWGSIAITN